MKSFIHVIDPISDHWPQPLSIFLQETIRHEHVFFLLEIMTIICLSLVIGVYLEFLQLVININGQGWIHGLVLADKILKPEKRGLCDITELIFESNLYLRFPLTSWRSP